MTEKKIINQTLDNLFQKNYIKLDDIEGGINIPLFNLKIEKKTVENLQRIMSFFKKEKKEEKEEEKEKKEKEKEKIEKEKIEKIENSLVTLLFTYRNYLEIIENLIVKVNTFKQRISELADEIIELSTNQDELANWNKHEKERTKSDDEEPFYLFDISYEIIHEDVKNALNETIKKHENLENSLLFFGSFSYGDNSSFQAKINIKLKEIYHQEFELKKYINIICDEANKLSPSPKYSNIIDDFKQLEKNNPSAFKKVNIYFEIDEKYKKGKSMRSAVSEYLTEHPEINMTESALLMAYSRYTNSELHQAFKILQQLNDSNFNKHIVQFAIFKHLCSNYYKKQPLGNYTFEEDNFSIMIVKREYNILVDIEEKKNSKNQIKYLERDWKVNRNVLALEELVSLHIKSNVKNSKNKYIKAAILAGLEQFSKYTENEFFVGLLDVKFDILRKRIQIVNPLGHRNSRVSYIKFFFKVYDQNPETLSYIRQKLSEKIIGYKPAKKNPAYYNKHKDIVVAHVKVNNLEFYEQLLSIYELIASQEIPNILLNITVGLENEKAIETTFNTFPLMRKQFRLNNPEMFQ